MQIAFYFVLEYNENLEMQCRILGFCGGGYEQQHLMGYGAVWVLKVKSM
jgi:hypothetical protein